MRRIYDSPALGRDDDSAFTPHERGDGDTEPRAMRSVPSGTLSRLLLPHSLRYRAISVSVSTPRESYPEGTTVPIEITMKNSLPVAVTVPTSSAVLWTWHVDGVTEASHVPLQDPPDGRKGFHFARGERKQFRRRWQQTFKVTENEWEPAGRGEFTIGAGINVPDAEAKGVYDETTVRIVP